MEETAYWAEDWQQIKTRPRYPHGHTNTHSPVRVKSLLLLWQQWSIPICITVRFLIKLPANFSSSGRLCLFITHSLCTPFSLVHNETVCGGPYFPPFIDKQKVVMTDLHTLSVTESVTIWGPGCVYMGCQWLDINVCCWNTEQECLRQWSQIIDFYLFIQVERSCYLSMWPLTNQELCFGCRAIQTWEKAVGEHRLLPRK